MYELIYSTQFKKDLKKLKKQSAKKFSLLFDVVLKLEEGGLSNIPQKNKPHPLAGNYKGYHDIHILPDLVLICKENDQGLTIKLARIGSHSEIFG
ncbi:MAG: type II toxin-antitoxin system YafQ family toxin [Prolixibacteraceae bacterium]|nr:type II toxin-antitoxin system YafQ family toxin [Prolixibacteraceae bacterium]